MRVEEVSVLRIPSTAYLAACLAGLAILAGCSSKREAGQKVQSSEAPPVTAPPPKDGGSGSPNAQYSRQFDSSQAARKRTESEWPPSVKPSTVNLTWNRSEERRVGKEC